MRKAIFFFVALAMTLAAKADNKNIRISTNATDLILQVGENGRVYQVYLGEKLLNADDANALTWEDGRGTDGGAQRRGWDVMSGNGNEDYFEPAISIMHSDGNPSTYLYYASHEQKAVLFAYNIHPRYNEKVLPVKLQGLDPQRKYKVEETNLLPGSHSGLRGHGKTFTGDYLMKVGLDAFYTGEMTSRAIEITAE